MARNRQRNLSWKYQISQALKQRLAIGESKFEAKKNGSMKDKIFSWGTYNTYQKQLIYFSEYIKSDHPDCKSIAKIDPTVANGYLQKLMDEGKSAHTIKMVASAIVKVTDLDRDKLIKTPDRHRANIKRSRGEINKRFNEDKNQDLVDFCKSTGLRRAELTQIKGSDLLEENGKFYLQVVRNTKGGRLRRAEIVGDVEKVVKMCQEAGNGKLYPSVEKDCPVHTYRADYANTVYNKYAEDEPESRYCCRKDKKGIWYDRKAMKITSECLGHSRIEVIAYSYLN